MNLAAAAIIIQLVTVLTKHWEEDNNVNLGTGAFQWTYVAKL